jgi:hypothetical protein
MEEAFASVLQQNIVSLMIKGQIKACFNLCVNRPGSDLVASEKQCLAMCQDRYQEVFQKTFFRQYQNFMNELQKGAHEEEE